MKRLTIAVLFSAAVCGCTVAGAGDPTGTGAFSLSPGQIAIVSQSTVTVELVRVNDSRCPSDVVCVTAGEALTILKLRGAGPDRTDTLHFAANPVASSVYGNVALEVIGVTPYPISTQMSATKTVTLRPIYPK